MPHEAFCARAREYEVWQRELVQRNVRAAQQRARAAGHDADAAPAEAPAEAAAEAPRDYPRGTIVALARTRGADAAAYKAVLARGVPNRADYVDVQEDAVYVRCATEAAAQQVTELRDELLVAPRRLEGAAEAAYWSKLPARVRNAALRRAQR